MKVFKVAAVIYYKTRRGERKAYLSPDGYVWGRRFQGVLLELQPVLRILRVRRKSNLFPEEIGEVVRIERG